MERKEAFEKRKMDFTPDEVRVVDDKGKEGSYFADKNS